MSANVKVKTLRAYKLVADKARSHKGDLPVIKSSDEVVSFLLKEVYDPEEISVVESFYALFLNANKEIKGYIKVSSGGVTGTLVDPRVIYCAALKCLATEIIVSHNHPSGSLKPSPEDIQMTKKLSEAAKLLSINFMDHIIVTPSGNYHSFAGHGELNF